MNHRRRDPHARRHRRAGRARLDQCRGRPPRLLRLAGRNGRRQGRDSRAGAVRPMSSSPTPTTIASSRGCGGFAGRVVTFGTAPRADVRATAVRLIAGSTGRRADVHTPAGRCDIDTSAARPRQSAERAGGGRRRARVRRAARRDRRARRAAAARRTTGARCSGCRAGSRLVDDSYNSSPAALMRSLETVAGRHRQRAQGRRARRDARTRRARRGAAPGVRPRRRGAGLDLLVRSAAMPRARSRTGAIAAACRADAVVHVADSEAAAAVALQRTRAGRPRAGEGIARDSARIGRGRRLRAEFA